MSFEQEMSLLETRIAQSTADGIEAVVVEETAQELRLANNAVIQAHEVRANTLTLRVIQNGSAVVTTNDWSPVWIKRSRKRPQSLGHRNVPEIIPRSAGRRPTYSVKKTLCTHIEPTTEEHLEWLAPAIAHSKWRVRFSRVTPLGTANRSFSFQCGEERSHSTTFFDTMLIAGDPSGCSGYAGEAGTFSKRGN